MEIKFNIKNTTGIITLARPKALNALNLDMVLQLSKKLKEWEKDNKVVRVLLQGEGKHFCAGGDVKSVHLSGQFSDLKKKFFLLEYALNFQINNFSKPYMSIWKGVVMGGGVGLSIYGDYRIATESTKFAMPETSIGFFPDVGGSFFLSRLENNIGKYIGLTGEMLHSADLLNLKLATHYCPEDKLDNLINEYIFDGSVKNYGSTLSPSLFSDDKKEFIQNNFSGDIHHIYKKIKEQKENSLILEKLANKCPMSLAVTAMLIEISKKENLSNCLKLEYNLSQKMTSRSDFAEGIEAVLIKKHHKPNWQPNSIKEINSNELDSLFFSQKNNELIL
tara:strand:+ start:54 stop:1055 length:1002 start_codon:yes stop_codon:yes gene_type:complete